MIKKEWLYQPNPVLAQWDCMASAVSQRNFGTGWSFPRGKMISYALMHIPLWQVVPTQWIYLDLRLLSRSCKSEQPHWARQAQDGYGRSLLFSTLLLLPLPGLISIQSVLLLPQNIPYLPLFHLPSAFLTSAGGSYSGCSISMVTQPPLPALPAPQVLQSGFMTFSLHPLLAHQPLHWWRADLGLCVSFRTILCRITQK